MRSWSKARRALDQHPSLKVLKPRDMAEAELVCIAGRGSQPEQGVGSSCKSLTASFGWALLPSCL